MVNWNSAWIIFKEWFNNNTGPIIFTVLLVSLVGFWIIKDWKKHKKAKTLVAPVIPPELVKQVLPIKEAASPFRELGVPNKLKEPKERDLIKDLKNINQRIFDDGEKINQSLIKQLEKAKKEIIQIEKKKEELLIHNNNLGNLYNNYEKRAKQLNAVIIGLEDSLKNGGKNGTETDSN